MEEGNGSGRLGDGTTTQRTSPVQIGTDTWVSISAGEAHSLGIKTGGTLWAWGWNGFGQLGDGTTTDRTAPVFIEANTLKWNSIDWGRYHTLIIKPDGTLWSWGNNAYGQLGINEEEEQWNEYVEQLVYEYYPEKSL